MLTQALLRRDPDAGQPMIERQRTRIIGTPLIIALGVHLQPHLKVPAEEQLLAVAAAAMNMLNALHALGFGGVWVTGPNSYDATVAAALGFIAPDRLAGFLFTGTPMEPPRPLRRPALDAHVTEWTGPIPTAA